MPEPIQISCSRCDFQTSSKRIWGNFQYILPDNTVLSISRTSGWCCSCENIEPVEQLPDRQKIEAEIVLIRTKLEQAHEVKGFKWFGTLFTTKRQAAERQRHQTQLNDDIKEKEMALHLLDLRTDHPCCLSCGSEDIVVIDIPSVKTGEVVDVPFMHPNCGGMLTARRSGIRLSMTFPVRSYDFNGKSKRANADPSSS